MEEIYVENSVRTRLLLAGIKELKEHGIKGFSLRRTAILAEVSCAAPYRHFKDKDELISAIVDYICSRWLLLCCEIEEVFKQDYKRLVIELAIANFRFWSGNSNFRSVLMLVATDNLNLSKFDEPVFGAIDKYCRDRGEEELAESRKYAVRALIYGTVMLANDSGALDHATALKNLRAKLEVEFQ